jgi:hypothetical protein
MAEFIDNSRKEVSKVQKRATNFGINDVILHNTAPEETYKEDIKRAKRLVKAGKFGKTRVIDSKWS